MRQKHKRVMALAKGYRGRGKNCWSTAGRRVEKAFQHAYMHRAKKKRDFRTQWIQQLNAGVRLHGMKYSTFVGSLPHAGVLLNRKVLADLAVTEPYSFKAVVETVKRTGFVSFLELQAAKNADAHARQRKDLDIRLGRKRFEYDLTESQRASLDSIGRSIDGRLSSDASKRSELELERVRQFMAKPLQGAPWGTPDAAKASPAAAAKASAER